MAVIVLPALVATIFSAHVGNVIENKLEEDIKQSDVNQNYIISLENRIKIKYVKAKNAVDYTCNRFLFIQSKVYNKRGCRRCSQRITLLKNVVYC